MAENADLIQALRNLTNELRASGNSSSFSPSNPTGASADDIRLRRLEEDMKKDSVKSMKEFVGSLEKMTKGKKLERAMMQSSSMMNDRVSDLGKSLKTAEDEIEFWGSNTGQRLRALGHEARWAAKAVERAEEGTKEYTAAVDRNIDIQRRYAEAIDDASQELGVNTGEVRANSNKLAYATIIIGALGVALKGVAEDTMMQFKNASQEGILALQKHTIFTGANAETLTQFSSANRQALNAMGGASNAFNYVEDNLVSLTKVTGDFDGNIQYVTDQMSVLAAAGIRPSINNFQQSTIALDRFRKLTGMTTEQFVQMNKTLVENSDVQRTLAALDKSERLERLRSIQTQTAMRVALGMTQQQAVEVAQTLEEMAGRPAMNRIEQGAKLAALAASQGIEGASEIQSLMIKGQRRSAEETERLRQIMTNLGDASARAGTASLGQELALQASMEQLGVARESIEKFGMTTADARSVEEEAVKDTIDNGLGPLADAAAHAAIRLGAVGSAITDKILGPLTGAAGDIFTTATGVGVAGFLAKMLGFGGPFGGGSAAAAGGAGALAKAGAMAKGAGMLGLGALGAGAAGAAGYGTGYLAYENIGGVRNVSQEFMGLLDKGLAALGVDSAEERVAALESQGGLDVFQALQEEQRAAREIQENARAVAAEGVDVERQMLSTLQRIEAQGEGGGGRYKLQGQGN